MLYALLCTLLCFRTFELLCDTSINKNGIMTVTQTNVTANTHIYTQNGQKLKVHFKNTYKEIASIIELM